MNTTSIKSMFAIALALLFVAGTLPVYASQRGAQLDPFFTIERHVSGDTTKVVEPSSESTGLISESSYGSNDKSACFYNWELDALGGEKMAAACVHPRHNHDGG